MNSVIYRVPGYPSTKSLLYLEALEANGWPDEVIARLREDLPRFESASIRDDFEQAMEVFVLQPHKDHLPFLQELNRYIKAITRATRNEELQRKATTGDKDSIAANTLLAISNNEPSTGYDLDLNVTVKNRRVKDLSDMTEADLKRELEATEKRLGVTPDAAKSKKE